MILAERRGGGGEKKKNELSRLHSSDIFLEDGNTSENDVLLTPWQHDDTTQVALVVVKNKLISGASK